MEHNVNDPPQDTQLFNQSSVENEEPYDPDANVVIPPSSQPAQSPAQYRSAPQVSEQNPALAGESVESNSELVSEQASTQQVVLEQQSVPLDPQVSNPPPFDQIVDQSTDSFQDMKQSDPAELSFDSLAENRPPNSAHAQESAASSGQDPYRFHETNAVHYSSPSAALAQCPAQSRLFIGNLATEKTSKEELASIFVKYGNILEISLKSSYGFIQFDTSSALEMAIQNENGRLVGGLRLGKSSLECKSFNIRL